MAIWLLISISAMSFQSYYTEVKKVIELIGQQHTTKEIAQLLFITEKTVENHRSNIMKKLNLPAEKNALLVWAVQNMPSK